MKAAKQSSGTPKRGTERPLLIQTPVLEPSLDALDALTCESLALCLTADRRPLAGAAGFLDWRLCGRLSRMIQAGILTGAPGEKVLMPTFGAVPPIRIFSFGFGEEAKVREGAEERFSWMIDVLEKAGTKSVAVLLPEPVNALLPLVDEHLAKRLGERLVGVFGPEAL